jgi:hypothetical protein
VKILKNRWWHTLAFMGLLLLTGCQTAPSNRAAYMSAEDLNRLEQRAVEGRRLFRQGDYETARLIFEEISQPTSVNQPLYHLELASVYLALGEKEKARQTLLATHQSIEGFFDSQSEKSAASLWGREADKVYKGDPYERGTLYLLLSLSLLEAGDVDNALAAVKTGLLADSDAENNSYHSDFALLQFIGAKCYDLRQEPDLRDQMLSATFKSFTALPETSAAYAAKLRSEFARSGPEKASPPSHLLKNLCSMASEEAINNWLIEQGAPPAEAGQIAQWAKKDVNTIDPLAFNTLMLLWRGTPPSMIQAGDYNEQRMIVAGVRPSDAVCSIMIDEAELDFIRGLGDINFQATTRGGRKMDEVLSSQAAVKGGADAAGNTALALSTQDYGDPYVNLGMALVGLAAKGIASAVNTEADIRHWANLPHTFEMATATLPPGTHDARLIKWDRAIPSGEMMLPITRNPDAPLTVVHLFPTDLLERAPPGRTKDATDLFALSSADPRKVDLNGDGEISPEEYRQAHALLDSTEGANDNRRQSLQHAQFKKAMVLDE